MIEDLTEELLPHGWELNELGEICSVRKEAVEPSEGVSLAYVGLEHITPGVPRVHHTGDPEDVRSTKYRFYEGDILYGKLRPYLDKVALADFRGICSTDIIVIKCGQEAYNGFLVNLLHTKHFTNYAIKTMTGVNHPRTSWNALKRFRWPIPPLPEQKKIAAVLSAVQEAKEKTEAVIVALKELKKSMMKHLFTYGPVPLVDASKVPLKETIIGLIPGEWEITSLGEASQSMDYGTSRRCNEVEKGIPVLRIPNVVTGKVYLHDLKTIEPLPLELKRKILEKGDLLFVRTNATKENLGRCAIYSGEPTKAIFASYLIRVRLGDESLIPEFVHLFTQSERGRAQLSGRASNAADGKFNINTQTIRGAVVPRPAVDIQNTIIEMVTVLDSKITHEEARLNALTELFRALLDNLMTGKIRVHNLEV